MRACDIWKKHLESCCLLKLVVVMGVVVLSDVVAVAVDVAEVDVDVVVKESLITLRATGQHKLNFFFKDHLFLPGHSLSAHLSLYLNR